MDEREDAFYGEEAEYDVMVKPRKRNMREAAIATANRPREAGLLKRARTCASYTEGDIVDVLEYEEHLRDTGFLSDKWVVHQRRAEGDPLYTLFLFPRSLVGIVDEETEETQEVEAMSKFCGDLLEYFVERYGDALTGDPMIAAFLQWCRRTNSTRIRLFVILYLLQLEESVVRYLSELCGATGFRGPDDYKRVAQRMKHFFHTVTHGEQIGDHNINQLVEDTITFALDAYTRPTRSGWGNPSLSAVRAHK